jgi:hypothetical protein
MDKVAKAAAAGDGHPYMETHMEHVRSGALTRMYLHRAADAVDTVTSQLSGIQLSPEAREEFAVGRRC